MQNVDNSSPSICDASVKQKDLKVNYGQSIHLSCPLHVNDFESSTAKYGPLKWYFYRNERSSGVEVSSRRDKFALTTDNGLVILGTSDRESGRYECKLGSLPLIRYEVFVDPSKSIFLSLLSFLFSLMLSLCFILLPPSALYLTLMTLSTHILFLSSLGQTESCSISSEAEFKSVYSDWCHEFEKYKSSMKAWQVKQTLKSQGHNK